jgi:hypothetical protein
MPARNVIQFRRGYSMGYSGAQIGDTPVSGNTWTGGIQLAEGEVGYEIDTGKFKIGRRNSGGTLITWENLDYGGGGGGGGLIPGSGIGILVNASGDDTISSYLTNADNNLQLTLNNISGLVPGATGTYYDIKLAQNIAVSGNIASTGVIISSGINLRNITNTITVTEAIGAIPAGTIFNSGTSISTILTQILEKVFNPTVGNNGGLGVSLNSSSAQEVGTQINNFTISTSFNQGTILGTGIGVNWNSSANQGVRYGAATNYTIDGVDTNLNTSYNKGTHTVTQGSNSFSATVDYGTGIVPKNSLGQNSTTLLQAPSGSLTNSASFTGFRGLFYGWSKDQNTAPTTSLQVRNLVANTSSNSGTMVNPSTRPYNFTLTLPSGTTRIVVAVPSGYNNFGNSIAVTNASNNPETYTTTSVNVSGANNFASIPYFIHTYIPAAPLGSNTTHAISVQ